MRRAPLLLALPLLAAACGGAKSPSVASVGPTTATAATSPAEAPSSADAGLAYAKCMRAHGEPGFPDPLPGGGFEFQAGSGVNPSSPAFRAASTSCRKLMPLVGLAPGTATHPTAKWLAQMIKAAQCMRAHGIASFPDPTTTIPQLPAGGGLVSDIDGAVFEFTGSIDEQSPQFVHAARVCGFPLHNH
jgi:hypothetical protein